MEHDAEHAVAASKRPTAETRALKITGLCHYCGEATPVDKPAEDVFLIAVWPDGAWCEADEIAEMLAHRSDDFERVTVPTGADPDEYAAGKRMVPPPPRRWCNATCRDEWQREQRVR